MLNMLLYAKRKDKYNIAQNFTICNLQHEQHLFICYFLLLRLLPICQAKEHLAYQNLSEKV